MDRYANSPKLPRYANSPRVPQKDNTLRLTVYWLVVGIPLVWGIILTLLKTLELFR